MKNPKIAIRLGEYKVVLIIYPVCCVVCVYRLCVQVCVLLRRTPDFTVRCFSREFIVSVWRNEFSHPENQEKGCVFLSPTSITPA